MTEDELAENLSTLLDDGMEESSSRTIGPVDDDEAASLLERRLPETIDADVFINNIIGFTTCVQDDETTAHPGARLNARPNTVEAVESQSQM